MFNRLKNFNLSIVVSVFLIVFFSIYLFNQKAEFGFSTSHEEILRLVRDNSYDIFSISIGNYTKNLYSDYPPEVLAEELPSEKVQQARRLFSQSFRHLKEAAETLRQEDSTLKISIVFPIHKKGKTRIQSSEETNNDPHSLDALRVKIVQLKELLDPYSDVISWELVVASSVPNGEGTEVVKRIAKEQEELGFIEQGQVRSYDFDTSIGKGGKITGTFQILIEEENPSDIYIYTDDDTSTDLRQLGILIGPMVNKAENIVIGSTKVNGSIRVDYPGGAGELDDAMKLVYKPLNQDFLLRPLMAEDGDNIQDTQRAFKAYNREVLGKILNDVEDKDFTFDTELMLLARAQGFGILETPIFWIDAPGSASTNSKTRWKMTLSFIDQYERLVLGQGLGEVTLDENQIRFLREYAEESIRRLENEDKSIEAQIERWKKLAEIIKTWY